MSDDKYKLFRQYMANELQITRDDIKQWTQEAIEMQVKKLVGQMDITGITRRAVQENLHEVRARIVNKLTEELTVSIKKTSKSEEAKG